MIDQVSDPNAERIRAAAMEEAARGHDALADALVEYRGGFTAHSPMWKEADLLASSHLQSAAAIRALAPTPAGMVCVPMDSIPQIVADAMQGEWNEICSDTACYPLDIKTVGKGGILRFAPGHWARAVGENVRRAMLAAAPGVKE